MTLQLILDPQRTVQSGAWLPELPVSTTSAFHRLIDNAPYPFWHVSLVFSVLKKFPCPVEALEVQSFFTGFVTDGARAMVRRAKANKWSDVRWSYRPLASNQNKQQINTHARAPDRRGGRQERPARLMRPRRRITISICVSHPSSLAGSFHREQKRSQQPMQRIPGYARCTINDQRLIRAYNSGRERGKENKWWRYDSNKLHRVWRGKWQVWFWMNEVWFM